MSTIHFTEISTATPEQLLAGITDFGPGRQELFANSSDAGLTVHATGPDWADVTEGGGGVWERLRYDWSNPRRIVMTTTDSNLWGGASGHVYTLTPQPDGTTRLDAEVIREGKNVKGKVTGALLGSVAKGALGKALHNTVKAIETRHAVTS
ncbi:SRPBCC family protein [Actinoplanes sp. NPDC020271]|uniref:SRPBCC family protein n=1 Tax=Actinoplanes sp. NPDC020271 TaxID=3363896 RepID=UPI00379ADD14